MRLVGAGLARSMHRDPLPGSLDRFLFGTAPRDVSTFSSAIAVLMCARALACWAACASRSRRRSMDRAANGLGVLAPA